MLFATGDGGAAARIDGPRWELPAESAGPCAPAQVQRGVVLVRRSQPALYDAAEGLLLAQFAAPRDAVLGPDLSCALLLDADVSLHRLATHLSLVQGS
jgi:hypothetical protein